MRIIIVEDNAMILQMLSTALRMVPGYEVVACDTAAAGLEACNASADLAIFDFRLPDMTGADAIARLRAQPQTQHLPIIVITGDNDRRTRLEAIRAGATDFLEKPINIDELRLRVRNLLALQEAQKQAQERQALLETLIAASGANIAVLDAKLDAMPILYMSDSYRNALGQGASPMIGDAASDLWQAIPTCEARANLEAALSERSAGRFVVAATAACGRVGRHWAEIMLRPVPQPGMAARYLVVTQRDVTDLMQMRQAHERLSARLADIARISSIWFFEVDEALNLSYVSDAMASALEMKPAQVQGSPVAQLSVRVGGGDKAGQPVVSLFAAPHRRIDNEMVSFHLPNGALRAVQISAVPFFDDEGQFAGYRGHASDVSAIARDRDMAARASRAKSAFLAAISHEMRTPLTAIIGMTEVLAQEVPGAAQSEHLRTITEAATNLADVLADVLDVASIEQGQLCLRSAPFDLVDGMVNVAEHSRQQAQGKGLRFDLKIEGEHRGLRLGDGGRLRQIVQALLSNAVKFTQDGAVSLKLDLTSAGLVRLVIHDTGIGMCQEDLAVLFQPFVQADDGIARRYEGAGLGLSLARWLVDAMAGSLDIRSAQGQGTTATVSLPLPLVAPHAEATELPLDLSGRRVLIADDNRTNRKILEVMVRNLGAELTLCEDGPQAFAQWQSEDFDLLLLDINMPGMAGTEVMRAIRADETARGLSPVPSLAITANARPEQVEEYLRIGFSGCVSKPFTGARLAANLREQVGLTGPTAVQHNAGEQI